MTSTRQAGCVSDCAAGSGAFGVVWGQAGSQVAGQGRLCGSGEREEFALALVEATTMGVTDASRQLHRVGEVQADLVRGMGIGAEGDGDAPFVGDCEQGRGRINLAAILPQSGGVEFDGRPAGLSSGEKGLE